MDTLIGRTLSHYRIVEQIGAGGMGVVYRARDENLQRDVALKVLPPHALEDEVARRRFRKEALALSKLNHARICTIHDFGNWEGLSFLVMEYVEGVTLAHRLREGSLAEGEVVRLGRQIADALGAAHEHGVIHRDLKPGNIMVKPDGEVKVLDFGLARERRAVGPESATLTATAEVVGTLPYMAPEQLMGEAADARTDTYSLGVVLYEMTTGFLPFEGGSSVALADAILHQDPILPRQRRRATSRGLEAVILRCLEKAPARRYPSARSLGDALGNSGSGPWLSEIVRRGWRKHRRIAVAGALALAFAVALFAIEQGGLFGHRTGGEGDPAIRSLAVLPLANLSGDSTQSYFADGMTEEAIIALSRIPGLRVISHQSVRGFRGSKDPVTKIARSLNVDAVVTGSVLRAGDRIRIALELIQASPERHLWADGFEGKAEEILVLQDSLAREIGQKIGANLTQDQPNRVSASRAVDPNAHDEYLRGRSLLDMRDVLHYQEALQHLTRAVTIDPLYAQGWAGLAGGYYSVSNIYIPPDQAMAKCRAAADRALSIDSSLVEAHVALGLAFTVYDCDWASAEREFRRAIDLNPSYAWARYWYAAMLTKVGRFEEMEEQYQRAYALDPLSRGIEGDMAYGDYVSGKYDRSLSRFRGLVNQEPENPVWHWSLALCHEAKGRFPEAIAEHQRAVSVASKEGADAIHQAARIFLCRSLALAGRRAEALALLRDLETETPASPYLFGTAHAALGDVDRAFQWFERALRGHDEELTNIKVDPKVRSLRSDPRYVALLQKLRLGPPLAS